MKKVRMSNAECRTEERAEVAAAWEKVWNTYPHKGDVSNYQAGILREFFVLGYEARRAEGEK